MKISLYLSDRIVDFRLPNEIAGSFSFDIDTNDSKLINVEARDGKWVLYGTTDVSVVHNNIIIDSIELISNNFYTLRRDDKGYLIYVSSLSLPNMLTYKCNSNMKLIIGNTESCSVRYNSFYLNDLLIGVGYNNNRLIIEKKGNTVIYVNKKAVIDNPSTLKYGDELEIYGLRIIFLKDLLFVSNLDNLFINAAQANIDSYIFPQLDMPKDLDVKDVELYSKNDYASKAPRIRRVIETKTIKLSAPPREGDSTEMPLILVIGPMFTMAIVSMTMLASNISKIRSGESSFSNSWPQLLTALAMLISMLVWPLLTQRFNRRFKRKKKKELIEKYNKYLVEKAEELESEAKQQKIILLENLVTVDECLENIMTRNINFWSKRIDQSDFLVVRIGMGNELLDAKIEYPEEGFTIEESELRKKADELVEKSKYIENVPIGYSFYDNMITAIMGHRNKSVNFINNIILQLVSFYSYEDLKIVIFTNKNNQKNWDYLRYLNHTFSNDRSFRFFGCDQDSTKNIAEYLNYEAVNRLNSFGNDKKNDVKPYYLIIIDDYEKVKRYDFIQTITESDNNLGFSLIIAENRLSRLPSKCDNFITLNENQSGVLKNSYEKQEQLIFYDEIHYDIDMMEVSKMCSNVPIEFEEGIKSLPNSVTFLEMEGVGKVEQLNILNRWNVNDSTSSLKSEIGIDEQGDLMYLDLHEKYHGPHGLIAGMTGSGKSEFIITYILSMCINYSPDDVAFILIDYKGGGLAFAFENKTTGVILPHLAGTITNLDKAEMDRTLVSIDSEIKRRQYVFNAARDRLGESTIDIYKYQRFYKEGRLNEPIPHLFIICDEFAELKSQQPDFMDNLISVARIGRSLGVHLILATQKPSGVVNDQIWSNTKFRVCLKVQDESDSREMLKRTEAAYLKQAGRFYLQVGYDEYFALGQSGWCGAKYYPSDMIVKQVDNSINFIDDCGFYIKSVQASNGIKIKPQGEQLSAIIKSIIGVSNHVGKKARRLWLDNISAVVLEDYLRNKYNFISQPYNVTAVIGEYDAPEKQEQGLVRYNFLEDGNTIIYGNDGSEREMLLDTIIYSSVKSHNVSELNYYIVDYGSESFRKYFKLPHIGGIVFSGEEEKYNNLLKLLRKEISYRKKLFADYGGEYQNYIKNSNNKLPLKVVILNNYDSIYENNSNIYEELPELIRDSERYGLVFIITCNAVNSVQSRISQNCHNIYTFKLKDDSDYNTIFGVRTKIVPRDILGRGLLKNDGVHEFQVATVYENQDNLNEYILNFVKQISEINTNKAVQIPVLPDYVRLENIISKVSDLQNIPVGIDKASLKICTIDGLSNIGNIISSNKIINTNAFVKSLLMIFNRISNIEVIVIDAVDMLGLNSGEFKNYYNSNFEQVLDSLIQYINKLIEIGSDNQGIVMIYGVSKFISSIKDSSKISKFIQLIKDYEKICLFIVDDYSKIKKFSFESWFTSIFNTSGGIWVGRGVSDQNLLHLSNMTRDMTKDYKNDMGYVINDSFGSLVKFIDFINSEEEEHDEK